MLIEHRGKRPNIDPAAVVAPTAVICGDVTIGQRSHVSFGAVLVAQGGPLCVGVQCVIRENVVIRSTAQHPVDIGNYVLIGPRASLNGCTVEDEVFLATGVTVFHGGTHRASCRGPRRRPRAQLGRRRRDGAHRLGRGGQPGLHPAPDKHDEIWSVQEPLNFPQVVYGVDCAAGGGVDMQEVTRRVIAGLAAHGDDRVL
jgi:hypothetical protein